MVSFCLGYASHQNHITSGVGIQNWVKLPPKKERVCYFLSIASAVVFLMGYTF